MLKLRIFRRWTWELACSPMEVRYGGTNPMKLVAHDELQYFHPTEYKLGMVSDGEWRPVEIVEGEKPKHPRDVEHDKECAKIRDGFKDIFKNAKQGHFAVGIQRHGEPSKCICSGMITNGKCDNDTDDRAI